MCEGLASTELQVQLRLRTGEERDTKFLRHVGDFRNSTNA